MVKIASEILAEVKSRYPLPGKDLYWKEIRQDPIFFEAVIDAVMGGQSVSTFARSFGLKPTRVCAWLATGLNDEQVKEYENARVIRASAMADRILDICDQVESGLLDAQQGKLIADNMKWIAARLDPHLWGDRIQIKAEVKTSAEQHLDAVRQLSEMIKKGKEGVVIEGEHVTKVIEHQPTIEELLS